MTAPEYDPEKDIRRLEEKVEALLLHCQRLQDENDTLNALLQEWVAERTEFSEQTAVAKNRVTAMITRLKSMGYKT